MLSKIQQQNFSVGGRGQAWLTCEVVVWENCSVGKTFQAGGTSLVNQDPLIKVRQNMGKTDINSTLQCD